MGADPKNARRAPKEQQRAQGSTQRRTGQRNQDEHQGACSLLLQFETPFLPGSCQLAVRRVRVLRSGRGPSCPGTSGSRPAHAQTNNERQTNKLKEAGGMGRRKINRCQMSGADRRPVLRKASRVGSPREEEEGAGGRKWCN